MSKKEKKVANSAISGVDAKAPITETDDIVVGVVENSSPAKQTGDELTIFDECTDLMGGPHHKLAEPTLTINFKKIELKPITLEHVQLLGRGLHSKTGEGHTGYLGYELFNKLVSEIRDGNKVDYYWFAKVNDQLFILSKGSTVELGNCWANGTAIFLCSHVKAERFTGRGELKMINTQVKCSGFYNNGKVKIEHSSINSEDISLYDRVDIEDSEVSGTNGVSISGSFIGKSRLCGWGHVKINQANINRYGHRGLTLSAMYNNRKKQPELSIENINLGCADLPESSYIDGSDVVIRHRTHIGMMPGIDPVEFYQTKDGDILLGGKLVLSLEDLESMRFRIPNPENPVSIQPWAMPYQPFGSTSVNKDEDGDKYDQLVKVFANVPRREKIDNGIDQLMAIHFRPFYDAIVSRVKLFRLLKALG